MRALLALCVFVLPGCGSEPDFDERFDKAEQEIRQKAQELDAELETSAQSGDDEAINDDSKS